MTMVAFDTGLQDPDKPDDDLVSNSTGTILVTDDEESDDQETVIVFDEYQPLSMDESADSNEGSSDDEDNESEDTGNSEVDNFNLPPINPIGEILVKELWSETVPKAVNIEMDSKKVDEVKKAMLNITLPSSSIPEWANSVPEEEWKQQLLKKLQTKNTSIP